MKNSCYLVSYPVPPKEDKVVWAKSDSSEEPPQTQPLSAFTTSGPWIEDAWVCPSSHNLGELLPSSVASLLPKIYLKFRILQDSIHLPPTALKSSCTTSSAAWKGNDRLGFICKSSWLFHNSAFGTTAIPQIRSWRKDLPNKNTTCCLKVNFLVFKALLFFRRFSCFTNNFHPRAVQVPTQHSLWFCSTFQVQYESKKSHLWFFLKTRTSKSSAHSKQPAMQSLRSCSHYTTAPCPWVHIPKMLQSGFHSTEIRSFHNHSWIFPETSCCSLQATGPKREPYSNAMF